MEKQDLNPDKDPNQLMVVTLFHEKYFRERRLNACNFLTNASNPISTRTNQERWTEREILREKQVKERWR